MGGREEFGMGRAIDCGGVLIVKNGNLFEVGGRHMDITG